jgi:hypothetical protein
MDCGSEWLDGRSLSLSDFEVPALDCDQVERREAISVPRSSSRTPNA